MSFEKNRFDIKGERKLTLDDWNIKEGGYKTLKEAFDDMKDFDQRLYSSLVGTHADRKGEDALYRFFISPDGGYGVFVFDINNEGKYEPGQLVKNLKVIIGEKELKGVEEIAEYYFEHPEEIK